MTNKKLFEQAVADAKTVKEAAMKNAKLQLEEELAPRLEKVWSSKLQEVEEDLDENFIPELEEGDDFNLDEMLAELELEETAGLDPLAESEDLDEAKKDDDKKDKKDDDKKDDKPKSDSKPKTPSEPKEPKEEKVSDLTVDDLKAIIADVVSSEMGAGADQGLGGEDDFGAENDMDADNFDTPDMGGDMEGAESDFNAPDMGMEDDEELNLDELLAELDNLDEVSEKDEIDEVKAELNEAIKTIKFLQKELADVNLLNAKMTYVNKLSEGRNLSNQQKIKIMAALDKVNTVKEAKLVYEALNSSLTLISNKQNPKSLVKENLGFASKPAGNAPRRQIVEVNENVNRWQFLAGIKNK